MTSTQKLNNTNCLHPAHTGVRIHHTTFSDQHCSLQLSKYLAT